MRTKVSYADILPISDWVAMNCRRKRYTPCREAKNAVFALLLPPIVPVLYCFFGALGYVAFREIFLGIGQNQPQEAAAITRATPLSSRA